MTDPKKFLKNWAEQLRAGALEVAENAEKIVGELDRNMELTVSIHLFTNTDEINWPYISIHRKIGSAPMNKAMRDYYKRDNEQTDGNASPRPNPSLSVNPPRIVPKND